MGGGVALDCFKYRFADEQNTENYRKGVDNRFTCVRCGRTHLPLDDTFSNKGKNMVCSVCVIDLGRIYNMSTSKVLQKFIWKGKEINGNNKRF